MSRRGVVLLFLAFLVFRTGLFAITTAGEYLLYQDYGESARRTSLADLYRTRDVEYPHLAVLLGSAASVVTDSLPDWAPRLVSLRPNKFDEPYRSTPAAEQERGDRYEVGFGLIVFVCDLGCLGLVYLIARRVYPNESVWVRTARLAGYAAFTGANGLILYDRQDLLVGGVALFAVWALAADRPALGYAVLAVGTGYKLVPALLLPVWVFAAAALRSAPAATPGRYLRAVVREAVVAGLILALWPATTYLFGGGERGFVYLTFHSARGLQVEAPSAWPIILLDPAVEVGHGFGGYNLRGEVADRVASFTRPGMLLAVALAALIAARGCWRFASASHRGTASDLVPHVVASALLVWLAFIVANKVGSPQFLLWLAPLVPLLPLRTWGERGWATLLLIAMLLTALIYPCRYLPDVIGPRVAEDPATWAGPNGLGLFLLAAKSITLAVATVWLAVRVWRNRPEPRAEPKP